MNPDTENSEGKEIFAFDGFRLDASRRVFTDENGESLPIMPKAFEILLHLVRRAGEVVEKEELLAAVWPDTIVEENNLTQNISALRRLLGEKHRENRFISTIPGRGYKFVAQVTEVAGQRADEVTGVPQDVGDDDTRDAPRDELPKGRFKPIYAAIAGLVILVTFVAYNWPFGWTGENTTPIRSVAVLPFTITDPNPETEYLSDGIAESVINSLSRLNELRVISRNSTFRFRDTQVDSAAIGKQLGVEAIVTGEIRQVGEEIVINVRLIRTRDDAQIWGNQYIKRPVDLILIQGEIAQAVAQNLKLRLSQTDSRMLGKKETENPEAWELYHRGRFHVFKLTPDEVEKGLKYFREAIEIDPNYSLAYTGIGDAYRSLTLSVEMPPREYLGLSRAALLKAIELDESLSEGHSGLGMTYFWGDWEWNQAERRYIRALELNPNNAMAHLFYAHLHSNLGRHDEALARVKISRELDPVFPFGNALEGQFLLHAGRVDEALDRLEKTIEVAPNFWMPYLFSSAAYIEKADYENAVRAARRASELSPAQTTSLAFEAFALAKAERRGEAEAILNMLLKRSAERFVPPYHIALVYHGLGDDDRTFLWLNKGFELRDPKMTFLKVDPKWKELRGDPRYMALLQQMNFE
ncbi:MAG: winged helix-turn-helix domain-containing protein [Blastocatellia bacterium]|nr:winged helix-turn-helix domain-containing protein [Blastocatellia bacterium]